MTPTPPRGTEGCGQVMIISFLITVICGVLLKRWLFG